MWDYHYFLLKEGPDWNVEMEQGRARLRSQQSFKDAAETWI